MPFLTPRDLRRGAATETFPEYRGPAGDARLYHVLDDALGMIEDYLGYSLRAHQIFDETHSYLGPTMPVFAHHAPVRGVQRFSGTPMTFVVYPSIESVDTQTVTETNLSHAPTIFGNVVVDRGNNLVQVRQYPIHYAVPWLSTGGGGPDLMMTYTAGFDMVDTPLWIVKTTVQGSPAPTATSFAVGSGLGPSVLVNVPIRVGTQTGTVRTVVGDLVTLTAPLATIPAPAAAVRQSDGVTLPPPSWLISMQRDVAISLVKIARTSSSGVAQGGKLRFGNVEWTQAGPTEPELPKTIRQALAQRFEAMSLEIG